MAVFNMLPSESGGPSNIMSTSKLCVNAERNEGRKPGEDSKQLFRQGEQETRYNSYSHQIWVIKIHDDQLYSAFHISKQMTTQSQYAYNVLCYVYTHKHTA